MNLCIPSFYADLSTLNTVFQCIHSFELSPKPISTRVPANPF